MMETPSIFISFLAGLLSFFSPCVLAMAPGYLAVLTGSAPTNEQEENRQQMIITATIFILGFTIVFVLLGTAFSALGQMVSGLREVFLIAMGDFSNLSSSTGISISCKKTTYRGNWLVSCWYNFCFWLDTLCRTYFRDDSDFGR